MLKLLPQLILLALLQFESLLLLFVLLLQPFQLLPQLILYLLCSKLPWQGLAHKRQSWAEQLNTISNAKATANIDELAPDADVLPRYIKSARLVVFRSRSWSKHRNGDSFSL